MDALEAFGRVLATGLHNRIAAGVGARFPSVLVIGGGGSTLTVKMWFPESKQ